MISPVRMPDSAGSTWTVDSLYLSAKVRQVKKIRALWNVFTCAITSTTVCMIFAPFSYNSTPQPNTGDLVHPLTADRVLSEASSSLIRGTRRVINASLQMPARRLHIGREASPPSVSALRPTNFGRRDPRLMRIRWKRLHGRAERSKRSKRAAGSRTGVLFRWSRSSGVHGVGRRGPL